MASTGAYTHDMLCIDIGQYLSNGSFQEINFIVGTLIALPFNPHVCNLYEQVHSLAAAHIALHHMGGFTAVFPATFN